MCMKENFTFYCFDLTFKVKMVDAWGGSVGLSRADTQEIRIDRNASEGMQKVALLHEFLHIVSYLFALNLPEETVAYLGVMLPVHWGEEDRPLYLRFEACLTSCNDLGRLNLTDVARATIATALTELGESSPGVFGDIFYGRKTDAQD